YTTSWRFATPHHDDSGLFPCRAAADILFRIKGQSPRPRIGRPMMDQRHKVVIIGGGFAGLLAALALRKAPVQITLLDRRNFPLSQPPLHQVAMGGLSPANIATPLRAILKNQKNAEVFLAEAVDFDLAGKRVLLSDGELTYDTLIVAAGMRDHYFGHD